MADTNLRNQLAFADAMTKAQDKIGEAVKILAVEPAAMQFFSIIELSPVNVPDVQLRLNTRDGGSTVYLEYNPQWICRLDDPSILAYFFYAEVLRIALHHCTTRRALPAQSQYLASNLLCFEDQRLLSKWRDNVKNMLSTIPTYQQVQPILAPLGFCKDKDWFLEKIKAYIEKAINQNKEKELQQQIQQMQQKQKQKQSQQGQGQGQLQNGQSQSQQQRGQGQPEQSPEEGQNTDGNANGNGNTDDGESDKDIRDGNTGNANASDCAKACQEYFDSSERHARTLTANWGENTMVDEEVQNIAQYIAKNPEMWGNMPGNLQELIVAANKGKFDPTRIVKHFKQEVQSELFEQSRTKANRRNPDLSGWRHKMMASMGFFTDVSGSMPDRDVAMGKAFMMNFIKHVELWAADWDTVCGPIERIKKDILKKNGSVNVTGRGGTNPQCILEKIKEDKLKLGGIVVFTDCGFNWPRPPSKWVNKIFIIGTDDGCCEPPEWCRFYLNIKDIREWYDRNK